ncbi:hypothetical protein SAMN02745824_0412 [Parasphingorhabdus marina DSM 22363]|uniref:Uncharacterized protein n=1 Tax=Parasphingorhabdus marina DSM 22363 TaxID=1123272 RepID=A0A1N6CND9_9SPHN|nr:hypothetical protein [Parasphingorhabdus marina]SIN59874.1 hypothetical protein SAMN02745824_0412 [Parasphingorhabdus marina DSM 22363]
MAERLIEKGVWGVTLILLALGMILALPGCSNDQSVFSGADKNEWEGRLKFVFVERSIVVPFFLTDSGALLLRPSQDTEYDGIGPLVEGDGINVADRMFHSGATYRFQGEISDEAVDEVQLLSIPTKIVDVESIALVKKGDGECTAYIGRIVPPRPGRGGFVPVLPEYAEGKKGMFIHDGRAKCTIVPRGKEMMSSITSVGSINTNEEVDWARPGPGTTSSFGN